MGATSRRSPSFEPSRVGRISEEGRPLGQISVTKQQPMVSVRPSWAYYLASANFKRIVYCRAMKSSALFLGTGRVKQQAACEN